jgi:hypothetical protein
MTFLVKSAKEFASVCLSSQRIKYLSTTNKRILLAEPSGWFSGKLSHEFIQDSLGKHGARAGWIVLFFNQQRNNLTRLYDYSRLGLAWLSIFLLLISSSNRGRENYTSQSLGGAIKQYICSAISFLL